MGKESLFSVTYAEARDRFQEAASALGAHLTAYPINAEANGTLTIDVAVLGEDDAPAMVVSSGVHGVEGFFGSAVQLGLLKRLSQAQTRPPLRYVLIHGVNPYGFFHLRRTNEENIDLNRNFRKEIEEYSGAPEGYAALDPFLNPPSPPSRFEPFALRAVWQVLRHGLPTLKQAVAGGQYEYPKGLFFGGQGPGQSTKILQKHCDAWLGSSQSIVHLDFHTGLGPFGSYKLLLTEAVDSENYPWYADTFGEDVLEPQDDLDAISYTVSGSFGRWMQDHFHDRSYRFATAEFGTYGVIRVLAGMRAENRAHHYGSAESPTYRSAKAQLLECFCPADSSWRRQVVQSGLTILAQAERFHG